jgi:hypothetical protein
MPALSASYCLESAGVSQLEAMPALASSHCLEFALEGGMARSAGEDRARDVGQGVVPGEEGPALREDLGRLAAEGHDP